MIKFHVLPSIKPMRLQRVAKPFDNPDYIFELKHDGFRAIAYMEVVLQLHDAMGAQRH
jgi:ATP-dependent DNA ligase